MRLTQEDHGDGNGCGGFPIRCYGHCHTCNREADMETIKAEWLEPVFFDLGGNASEQSQLCPKCARWRIRYWIKVVLRWRIGKLAALLSPGYGECGRCHTNWQFCEGHSTQYSEGSGCFPLCEQCWSELKPTDRIPYYRSLWESWNKAEGEISDYKAPEWLAIERAVLAGL